MELDDLKKNWEAINAQSPNQQNLTAEIIDKITTRKYYKAINKIRYPEWAGAMVCFMAAAFMGFYFNRLDTFLFQAAGITGIMILLMIPAISVISVSRFNVNDLTKPYAGTLRQFALRKLRFQKFQYINIHLSYLLLAIIIILLPKFFYGKNIADNKSYFWIFAFSFGYIFLLFFSKWINRFYNKKLNQAEELLKEIES